MAKVWKSDQKIIGENIKKARKAAKLTQEQFAEEMGGSCSNKVISRYEKGEVEMGVQTLIDIAENLEVPVDSLMPERVQVHLPDPAPADRTVGPERADGGGIQKKPRKSEREMTTPLFLLRCVQLGISIADLDLLTIGLVNDMFTERQNDDYPYKELASQEDFDRF